MPPVQTRFSLKYYDFITQVELSLAFTAGTFQRRSDMGARKVRNWQSSGMAPPGRQARCCHCWSLATGG